MRRIITLGALAFVGSLIAVAACVGDAPAVSGGTDGGQVDGASGGGADSGGGGDSGGGADVGSAGDGASSGGTNDGAACAGNTVDACGTSCTKCVAPDGGTVDCVSGACQSKCSGAQTVCGDTCIDTTNAAANCGACNHSCGAGQCTASACQPFPVATGFTAVHAIASSPSGIVIAADSNISLCSKPEGCTAVGALTTIKAGLSELSDVTVAGTNVYFNANEGDFAEVYQCPVAGCPAAGPILIESIVNDGIGRVVAGPSNVLWTRENGFAGPYTRGCSLPACDTVVDVRAKGTVQNSTNNARENTDPTKITSVGAVSTLWGTGGLYDDSTKDLRSCTIASPATCATPTELDTADSVVLALTYYNGNHYGASVGAGGGDVIFSVSDATPGARTALVSDAAGITDVAVDTSGIYWVNGTTGNVLHCATLTGCAGSGTTIATGQSGASRIALDATYVYWMTATSVMKLAK